MGWQWHLCLVIGKYVCAAFHSPLIYLYHVTGIDMPIPRQSELTFAMIHCIFTWCMVAIIFIVNLHVSVGNSHYIHCKWLVVHIQCESLIEWQWHLSIVTATLLAPAFPQLRLKRPTHCYSTFSSLVLQPPAPLFPSSGASAPPLSWHRLYHLLLPRPRTIKPPSDIMLM